MKTMRLWYERDPALPAAQRLHYAWTEVPLRQVLLAGIHPWQGLYAHPSLQQALADRLNGDDLKPAALEAGGYCRDLYGGFSGSPHYGEGSPLEQLLTQVGERVLFVDEGCGPEGLLASAREQLARRWTHTTVRELLYRLGLNFNGLRRFIKARAPQVKLGGYADLERYDLAELLSLADFDRQPDLLIYLVWPSITCRRQAFLASVTTDGGYLSLLPEIDRFQLRVSGAGGRVTYNGQRQGDGVRLIPHLQGGEGERRLARGIAGRNSGGRQRYCFSLRLEALCRLVEVEGAQIAFPSLSYTEMVSRLISQATVRPLRVTSYGVGRTVTAADTAAALQQRLGAYGVSRQGNKGELVVKLADLAVRVYGEHESEMDRYFRAQPFIRAAGVGSQQPEPFPLLQDILLRNLTLTLYLLRHLRGDAVVDPDYEDDSYSVKDLALALLEKRVQLTDAFLRVETIGERRTAET